MQVELLENPNYQEIVKDYQDYLEYYTLNNGDIILVDDCVNFLEFLSSLECGEKSQRTLNLDKKIRKEVLIELSGLYNCKDQFKKYDAITQPDLYPKKAIEIIKFALKDFLKAGNNVVVGPKGGVGTQGKPVPPLIRQAVYFVIYSTLIVNVETINNSKELRDLGYQKAFIDAVGMKTKIFNSWKMYPIQDFKFSLNPNIQLDFNRNGHKRDSLLYVITGLVNETHPRRFIDVFGGSGAVTASTDKKDCEILNEYDIFLWNYLDCISKDVKRVIDECRNIHRTILKIDPSTAVEGKRILDSKMGKMAGNYTAKEQTVISDYQDFYIQYQEYAKIQIMSMNDYRKLLKNILHVSEGINNNSFSAWAKNDAFSDWKNWADNNKQVIKDIEARRYELAAICYFIHAFSSPSISNGVDISRFTMRGYADWLVAIGYKRVSKGDIYETSDTSDGFFKIKHEKIIDNPNLVFSTYNVPLKKFGERLKNTIILNKDFREILELADSRTKPNGEIVYSKGISPENTVVYLDPPYFLTAQYDDAFPDSYHLKMLEWMRTTKCHWIMSCKDKITNTTTKHNKYRKEKDDDKLIKDFKEYFKILGYGVDIYDTGSDIVANQPNENNDKTKDFFVFKMLGISEGKKEYDEIFITNFDAPEDTMDFYYLFWEKDTSEETRLNNVEKYKDKKFTSKMTYEDFLKTL